MNTFGPSSIDIVIVNWNAGNMLAECVSSLDDAGFWTSGPVSAARGKAIVVDNGSTDHSLALAQTVSKGPIVAIRNRDNRGFARACNQGAVAGQAPFILFLNPDTRLYPESLRAPLELFQMPGAEKLGVVGIQLIDESGHIARSCARIPTAFSMITTALGLDRFAPRRFPSFLMKDWDHASTRPVDHVIGAFYLIRRELFERLGGFDERFFVYLEDLDLSLRAKEAGWKCVFFSGASAYHKGGGASEKAKASRLAYSLESRLKFAFKHFSFLAASGVTLAAFALEPWFRLALAAVERSPARVQETVGGYARLLGRLIGKLAGARAQA